MEYVIENGSSVRRVVNKTVTTTTTRKTSSGGGGTSEIVETTSNQGGGGEGGEGTEVVEYIDENGRRVRRVLKTTTTTRSVSNGGARSGNVSIQTREISSGPGRITVNVAGMQPEKKVQLESTPRPVQEQQVLLQFGAKPPATKGTQKVIIGVKGQPYPSQDVQFFEKRGHSSIATESFRSESQGGYSSTVHQRSVVTKTIGGSEGRTGGIRSIEFSTKSSGHGGEDPVVVVNKERSQVDFPDWLEEGQEEKEKPPTKEHSEIGIHLKYPSDYAPKKVDAGHVNVHEVKIQPVVAKRDKPDIMLLSLEEIVKKNDEVKKSDQKVVESAPAPAAAATESEEEDSEDSEYDEFEEEIVVMEVRRKPAYHKGLEIPKREPPKVGVPIEDLLMIPQVQQEQESAPKGFPIDENIEAVEVPPVECAMPDFGVLDNL